MEENRDKASASTLFKYEALKCTAERARTTINPSKKIARLFIFGGRNHLRGRRPYDYFGILTK